MSTPFPFVLRFVGPILSVCLAAFAASSPVLAQDVFRLGIIGTTTSHVPAFVKVLHDPAVAEPCTGFRIVAAYPGGVPDNPDSWKRVKRYADGIKSQGVKLYNTIEDMLPHVDGVLLESVDGRPHLEQAKPVIAAGKPLFIDKPIAGTLADALTIFRLAEEKNVPVFSASALRYGPGTRQLRDESPVGKIVGCDAWSPCALNARHPDLFWYGIHGVEILFTIMGPGCKTVTRTQTPSSELVVGVWTDGRIGTFRGIRQGKRGYGATVFGETGVTQVGKYGGYRPLVEEFCRFFRSGKAPIDPRETIEMFAFMEAADRSKQGGEKAALRISIDDLIAEASKEISVPVRVDVAADGTVRLEGRATPPNALAAALDALVEGKPNHRVKVILSSEKGAPIETVQKICEHFGKAMLANYLYDYDAL